MVVIACIKYFQSLFKSVRPGMEKIDPCLFLEYLNRLSKEVFLKDESIYRLVKQSWLELLTEASKNSKTIEHFMENGSLIQLSQGLIENKEFAFEDSIITIISNICEHSKETSIVLGKSELLDFMFRKV